PVAPASGARLVDPGVAQDSEQPRRQGRAGPKLVRARQGTLDRDVHQIISIVHVSAECPCKASQPRQQRDNLFAKVFDQCRHAVSGSTAKVALLIITAPVITTAPVAQAQVTVPNVRLPTLPQPQLPSVEGTLSSTVGQVADPAVLKDVRRLKLR